MANFDCGSSQLVEDSCQVGCLHRLLDVMLAGDRGTRVAELSGRIVIAPLAIDQGGDRLSERQIGRLSDGDLLRLNRGLLVFLGLAV